MKNFDLSVKRFDEFAEEYAQRFMEIGAYFDSIELFCASIKSDFPRILELGCGPGNVTRVLKQRFPKSRITALDLAPRMIELARKTLPEVDFKVMDVRDISTISEQFDAIMCSFCLPFLSATDATKLIADCADRLITGGVFYLSTMEGDETRAGFESTSFSGESKFYFNYHRQADLEATFFENRFKILQAKRQDYQEPDGSLTTDLIFIGQAGDN